MGAVSECCVLVSLEVAALGNSEFSPSTSLGIKIQSSECNASVVLPRRAQRSTELIAPCCSVISVVSFLSAHSQIRIFAHLRSYVRETRPSKKIQYPPRPRSIDRAEAPPENGRTYAWNRKKIADQICQPSSWHQGAVGKRGGWTRARHLNE